MLAITAFNEGSSLTPRVDHFSFYRHVVKAGNLGLMNDLRDVSVAVASETKGAHMLHYALAFFIVAIIAAVFGFTGIAAGAAEIAKLLFFIFLVVFFVTLIAGLLRR